MMDQDHNQLYDMEVELTMLPSEENSGRIHPIRSGFRNCFVIDKLYIAANFIWQDRDELWPGETAQVFVTLIAPDLLLGKVRSGRQFELREAGRLIGKGVILSLLNFAKHAEISKWQAEERIVQDSKPNKQYPRPD